MLITGRAICPINTGTRIRIRGRVSTWAWLTRLVSTTSRSLLSPALTRCRVPVATV